MIKIHNEELNVTKVVTQGAYRETYESLDYKIVNEKPLKKEVEKKLEKFDEVIKKEDKGEHNKFSRKQV